MSMSMTSRIAKDTLGVAALMAAAALVGWHCHAHLILPNAPHDAAHTAAADFRDVMYYPTRAMLAGLNPYDSSADNPDSYANRYPAGNNFPLYSPLIFVPALPLAGLPIGASVVVWWLLTAGLTIVLAYVAWRSVGIVPTVAMTASLAAAILLSRPGYANIYFGQATLLFLLASLAALHWAQRKPYLAGLALAIATMKPTFGGPLAILMFARRDWKAASIGSILGLSAAVLGLTIISARDASGKSMTSVLRANQEITEGDPAVDPSKTNSRIDAPLVVERLMGRAAAPLARVVAPLVVLGITGFVLWRTTSHRASRAAAAGGPSVERLSSELILVTMAGCIYHNIYDGLLLVVPAAMAFPWPGTRRTASSWWTSMIICALLLVPSFSYFSSQQFGQLLARMFPSVIVGVWTPGHTPLVVQLANGCAVIGAWFLLLIVTSRAVSHRGTDTVRATRLSKADFQPNESLALVTVEFAAPPPAQASAYLASQRQAAPLPNFDPKGLCQ
jgi:hypothetical protein